VTTRAKILAAAGVVIFLLVYPFPVTVMPEWNVKVVDQNGAAVPGAYLLEFANQWTLDFHDEQAICSDANGEAHFARRTVPASVVTRVSEFISKLGPHASLGPDVKMSAEGLGFGDEANESMTKWNGWSNHVNSKLVLHRCPKGRTSYKCSFDYAYWFGINGSAAKQIAACQSAP
jgi:hypothetical protein